MSSLVLSSAACLSDGHKHVYDIQALNHNAKQCRLLAEMHGFSMRVVLKGGYLHPNIVGELTQNPDLRFALGKNNKNVLDLLQGRDIATLYPRQPLHRGGAKAFDRIVAADISDLGKSSESMEPEIIVPVATSENREGLDFRDIADFVIETEDRYSDRVQIGGFQMNFGCLVEDSPRASEIQHLLDRLSIREITCRLADAPVMSIGGSAVLPILDQLDVPKNYHSELRVGEAILTGSVPGGQHVFGLKPTSFVNASIVQELRSNQKGIRRVLLDVGHTVFDDQATDRDYRGMRFESLSSDVAVAQIDTSRRTVDGAHVRLPLNYRETERALARHPNDISFLVGC